MDYEDSLSPEEQAVAEAAAEAAQLHQQQRLAEDAVANAAVAHQSIQPTIQQPTRPEEQRMLDLMNENDHLLQALRRERKRLEVLLPENTSTFALESYESRINDLWHRFDENHCAIIRIPEHVNRQYTTQNFYLRAEDEFMRAMEKMGLVLRDLNRIELPPQQFQAGMAPRPRLPQIDLPKFSGDILKWESYRDQFLSMVHNCAYLDPVQKLVHLQRSLEGEAAEVIRNTPPTGNAYISAWNALVTRYGNHRILTMMHMKSLMDLQPETSSNPTEIKRVFDFVNQTVRSFMTLNKPLKEWNEWIVFLLTSKLDQQTRLDWETSLMASSEVPEFQKLADFLENRLQALQTGTSSIPTSNIDQHQRKVSGTFPRTKNGTAAVATSRNRSTRYAICAQPHQTSGCPKYLEANTAARWDTVKAKKLCSNCLGSGHFKSSCPSSGRCRICSSHHHTTLHSEKEQGAQKPPRMEKSINGVATNGSQGPDQQLNQELAHQEVQQRSNSLVSLARVSNTVLLATARIAVIGPTGKSVEARAFLDAGADTSFVSQAVVQAVAVKPQRVDISVWGFSSSKPLHVRHQAQLTIANHDGSFQTRITALVKRRLNLMIPSAQVQAQSWPHIQGLHLADPGCTKPAAVDVLLGADIWNRVFLDQRLQGPPGAPDAYLTQFGFVLLGPTSSNTGPIAVNSVTSQESADICRDLRRFWEEEAVHTKPIQSPEDKICEEHFQCTHTRDRTGRYIVRLPLKQPVGNLLDGTRPRAVALMKKLEERFKRDPVFEQKYRDFLKEYLELGHMRIVPQEQNHQPAHYIPHHGVFKNRDPSGKIRVVFNASAKTSSGHSLNGLLYTGPKSQEDLWIIFLRWRMFRMVYSTDCVKFYRQVAIYPGDWHLLRIILPSENGNIQEAELTTNTYGTAPAQWIALRVLQQMIIDEGSRFPRAVKVVQKNKYIDDYLFGADEVEELELIKEELVQFLQTGGMELAKWASNLGQNGEPPTKSVLCSGDEGVQTLGVVWIPSRDTFTVTVKLKQLQGEITKRSVLSDMAGIFDVTGSKAPVAIRAKIKMQDLWLAGTDWDDIIEECLRDEWLEIRRDLEELPKYEEERWLQTSSTGKLQVHGFSDASSRAYAAVVYFRTENEVGVSSTMAICKTRVAPIKTISIPKLELAAAYLLAQLLDQIKQHLDLEEVEFFAWSDAKVALAWIRSHPSRWNPYVANRVSQIQTLTDVSIWDYVDTKSNPADLATRGMSAKALHESTLWRHGPPWLLQDRSMWPRSLSPDEQITLELKSTANVFAVNEVQEWDLFSRYSSLPKLVRLVSAVNLFVENRKEKREQRRLGNIHLAARNFRLTPKQLAAGLQLIIRITQKCFFPAEFKALKNHGRIPARSPLLNLRPIIGLDGCIRVGGRLHRASLPYEEKHPCIIPRGSILARLLAKDAHTRTMHGGTQLTHRHVSSEFWILRGRSLVRSVIRNCVRCTRFRAQPMQQIMAPLPKYRVKPQRPFLRSGVDFAGPIQLRASAGRGSKSFKAYICVFICLSTKAIHLEVAVDLSTQGFISAFRRFISRRGRCSELHSDNGTNFKGASAELKQMFTEASKFYKKCATVLADEGTNWSFIPASAPHFGGIWEAGVKSVKHHLRRVIGQSTLTYEEMSTLLAQIEACLNSRPLTKMVEDPQGSLALTPGHFLVGEPLLALPELPVPDKVPLTKRYLMVTRMRDDFWSRWSKEYLHELQILTKWDQVKESAAVDQVVLIKDELTRPARWPLARVIKTFPDSAGVVRTVEVQTSSGVFLRPIHKLILLPVDSSSDLTTK